MTDGKIKKKKINKTTPVWYRGNKRKEATDPDFILKTFFFILCTWSQTLCTA